MNKIISPKFLTHFMSYDTERFPFLEVISNIIMLSYPETAHDHVQFYKKIITRESDQHTIFHKRYYSHATNDYTTTDKWNPPFREVYKKFVYDIIRPIFREEILYQRIPTFRVQFPENKGVGEFHRDLDYNHNSSEINFFLPFTPAKETSTIWIETEPGLEDYYPLNADYGQVVMFNGCHLKHGNKINMTGKTRMSVDFRVIPLSKYKEEPGKESINTKMKFKIGDYYEVMR